MQPILQKDDELTEYFRLMACRAWKDFNTCLHYNPKWQSFTSQEGRRTALYECKRHNAWLHKYAFPKLEKDQPGEPHTVCGMEPG